VKSWRDELLSCYFPAFAAEGDFIYTKSLDAEHLQASGPCLTAVIDTLCLLLTGTQHENKSWVHAALQKRTTVLGHIRTQLAREGAELDDEILASMWILSFCDPLEAASGKPQAAHIHWKAVQRVMLSRVPARKSSAMAQMLTYNVRSIA
jgi:hypothetical protein